MNPFTRFLRSQRRTTPADLEEFILRWDALESLIINVYRAGAVDAEAEAAYGELRTWLQAHYRDWAASQRHLPMLRAGGSQESKEAPQVDGRRPADPGPVLPGEPR